MVIRGRNVTKGYEANPEANAKAFTNGWFRTGDQGVIDEDGYLRLTGRLKELINRGGEKISPLEVDTVIMDHPAVAQVVTFGVPHDKLGEDVAAAVVLREGSACDERELRDFVGSRIADFKVPRRIVFLTEIPKGATGKLQRIGLQRSWPTSWEQRDEARHLRRGRDRRLSGGQAAPGGRRRHRDRARAASGRHAGKRPDAEKRGRDRHRPPALHRQGRRMPACRIM